MELHSLPVIDHALSIKLAGNKKELAQELLDLFIKTLPDEISIIKQAFQEKNYVHLSQSLHKLHGAVCYCGLPRLKTLLVHLESQLKNNIMSDLPSLLNQLNSEAELLLEHYSECVNQEREDICLMCASA